MNKGIIISALTLLLAGCGGSSNESHTAVADYDLDGVVDSEDAFPKNKNESRDTDLDGIGNNSDTDDDGDGVLDIDDAFPLDSSETLDTDLDGIGNNSDTDDDGDGVPDIDDAFPLDSSETLDTDLDGIGNNSDTDDDEDGVLDVDDAFPLDSSEILDTDLDGIGNNNDTDDDGDGVLDIDDAFPLDSTETLDSDSDGVGDNADIEPFNPLVPDDQTDTDGDGATDYVEKNISLTNPNLRDSDSDGMWDGYEIKYDLAPLSSTDNTRDNDADGYTNLQEFYADSNPNQFSERPRVTSWLSTHANPQKNNFVNIESDNGNFQPLWNIAHPMIGSNTHIITNNDLYYVYIDDTDSYKVIEAYSINDNSLLWRSDSIWGIGHVQLIKEDKLIMSGGFQVDKFEWQTKNYFLDAIRGNVLGTSITFYESSHGDFIYKTISDDKFTYKRIGNYPGWFLISETGAEEVDELNIGWPTGYLEYSQTGSIGSYSNLVLNYKMDTGLNEVVNIDPHLLKATWKTELPESVNIYSAAIAEGRIYYTNGQNILVLDESTGEQLANWPVSNEGSLNSNIALTNNVLFVGDLYSTYALSIDNGKVIWQTSVSGKLSLSKNGELLINTSTEIRAFAVAIHDADDDNVPDEWEKQSGFDYNNPNDMDGDVDKDGLINRLEYLYKTNPFAADTDNDGVNDGDEIKFNTSPLESDTDKDGLSDYAEIFTYLTQPTLSDSDRDGFSDYDEVLLFNSNPNDSAQIPAPIDKFEINFDNDMLSPHWSNNYGWEIVGSENKYLSHSTFIKTGEPAKISYRNYFTQGILSLDATSNRYAEVVVQIDGKNISSFVIVPYSSSKVINIPVPAGLHDLTLKSYHLVDMSNGEKNYVHIDNLRFLAD
ncbi:hypothetical protein B0W48_02375 [Pseudoalteromonas aliena]|uniref:Uncharacterized protein n=1 Tax=Pseudoalteromonas aliena TaxID=247523 RepID=A0A1Q2GUG3_9GAMM|nr:PQQ-binding-like beta-propeller repeat protein [Pseudoalteromonas aliena]AQP98746.1 hypothetical protein B0W48_02375 [Pseudoalteromonas aliena]